MTLADLRLSDSATSDWSIFSSVKGTRHACFPGGAHGARPHGRDYGHAIAARKPWLQASARGGTRDLADAARTHRPPGGADTQIWLATARAGPAPLTHPSCRHVDRLDRVDARFNQLWLDFIYAGMYSRGILDDRTRILCIVGELCCLGELHQAESHIRNALMHGAKPREVLEVRPGRRSTRGCRASCVSSRSSSALEEQGRLAELIDTQLPIQA